MSTPPARPKIVWFAPWGWIYQPVAPAGWLLTAIAALFVVQVLGEAWLAYRSLYGAFFISFPYVVSAAAILNWVASKSSKP